MESTSTHQRPAMHTAEAEAHRRSALLPNYFNLIVQCTLHGSQTLEVQWSSYTPLHEVGGFRGFCLVFCRDPLLVLLSKSAGLAAEFSFYNWLAAELDSPVQNWSKPTQATFWSCLSIASVQFVNQQVWFEFFMPGAVKIISRLSMPVLFESWFK